MIRAVLIAATVGLIAPLTGHAGSDEAKEVDLTTLVPRGTLMRILTDGRPIWVTYRTKESIAKLLENAHIHYPNDPQTIDPGYRSAKKDYFVVFGGCPEGSELPAYYPESGFVCLSDCGTFDMAGRPLNECAGQEPMEIPEHYYKNESTLVIPVHQDGNT
ncbi:MAG: hypothetical protein KZQ91_15870 [Candidatus Thiodiazotropha sp. (ex Lucinoma borealis)]|nr:hypothetical protein [Candidatus Thiodiazotropha sp. (ex Lucinoma borealis)]